MMLPLFIFNFRADQTVVGLPRSWLVTLLREAAVTEISNHLLCIAFKKGGERGINLKVLMFFILKKRNYYARVKHTYLCHCTITRAIDR